MDDYLRGLSPFDPNGSLSDADADRIWASYKAAGGGRDVSGSLPSGGGLPSGDLRGRAMFGSMSGNGGLLQSIMARMNPAGSGNPAPAVPNDGAMQPTIGPGAAPAPAAPTYTPKLGLPQGGLLSMMQGGSPQGLMGLLQHLSRGQGGAPMGGMPAAAGMMSGLPGTPGASAEGPVAPTPQLPMNINPADQF